ncbi:MAG: cob(I)yrinic acid a,c-diamide adenosyltransferase [Pseudomonadota bacterium]
MKLFNKKGDEGYTSMLFGQRIRKSDPRPETYGTLDEANSTLGFARALSKNNRVKEIIYRVQEMLFIMGAELATDPKDYIKLNKKIGEDDVQELQNIIEKIEDKISLPKSFIIPGASLVSASLDMARTVIRRGERRAVILKDNNLLLNDRILAYLNRTADLLFILARYEESLNGESI